MKTDDPQFKLRVPIELKTAIVSAAKNNNRSINAEIVFRLQKSFVDNDLLKKIDTILDKLDNLK